MLTQPAENPIQVTYEGMHDKFLLNFPHLVAPLEGVKDKLDRGEGASDLANLIRCEVSVAEEESHFLYTWEGQNGNAFELRLLKPFDPTPKAQPRAPQESPEVPQAEVALEDAPDAPEEAPAPSEEPPEPEPTPIGPKTSEDSPVPSVGVFTALAELIGESTLLMTLAKHDNDLTVNVMPFGDEKDTSITAVCVTARPAELDAGFAQVIRVKVEGRKSLAEQVEELQTAEKNLADAKKAEADAKKTEAGQKKKATEAKKKEKEEEKRKAEEAAEKAGKQEAIF